MEGTAADTFAPQSNLTRAMLWTILAREAGIDTSGGEAWWTAGREWVVANGISDGSDATRSVTRNELATMLYRIQNPGEDGYDGDAVDWAKSAKLMEDGRPKDTATRAEVAALLQRFLENVK
jgi:hypothetical protein